MKKNILNYILLFLVVTLGFQIFFAPTPEPTNNDQPLIFTTSKKSYGIGKTIELDIKNNTNYRITFNQSCPKQPFTVFKTTSNLQETVTSNPSIDCSEIQDSALKPIVINPQKTTRIRYTYWSNDLFKLGQEYKIGTQITLKGKTHQIYSNTFNITKRGFISNLWLQLFYQPIYNILIAIISFIPGHSLGFAIIILTIILRLILYIPNQKSLVAQKKLAEVQPELNKIKEKYKDNQAKIAEETMKIWKTHNVNPASGCLPILIQFPILIGLFYAIQDGLNPDNTWLLYSFLSDFDLSQIDVNFLNILNLKRNNILVLPLLIGALQFIQIKLSTNQSQASKSSDKNDPNAIVQSTMLYVMPAMIAVFTASLPAGVGLYWGISTSVAIIQQLFINKKFKSGGYSANNSSSKKSKKDKKSDTRVKVIDV